MKNIDSNAEAIEDNRRKPDQESQNPDDQHQDHHDREYNHFKDQSEQEHGRPPFPSQQLPFSAAGLDSSIPSSSSFCIRAYRQLNRETAAY